MSANFTVPTLRDFDDSHIPAEHRFAMPKIHDVALLQETEIHALPNLDEFDKILWSACERREWNEACLA